MKSYTCEEHTFAVCAWGKSEYLEECIRSLLGQTVKSRIILCTATPDPFLQEKADRYGLPLYVRKGEPGIAEDWSYAYRKACTPLVTLAHQDDVYEPEFLEKTLKILSEADHPLISFCDYYELRDGEKVFADKNRNLRIKEVMLLPLRLKKMQKSRWCRRRILSLGNPVCCPSVTYVKENLPRRVFSAGFKADLDWQAWERLSRLPGSFCYLPECLMGHRIHGGSATTRVIGENRNRSREDLEMYRKFWPESIARFLNRFYAASQDENRTGKNRNRSI